MITSNKFIKTNNQNNMRKNPKMINLIIAISSNKKYRNRK